MAAGAVEPKLIIMTTEAPLLDLRLTGKQISTYYRSDRSLQLDNQQSNLTSYK
ncbi:Fibrocystin [Manis pentadactyla]|nr:Fibrocystin [Manis pentadactyla]